jgi:hypothetical protein
LVLIVCHFKFENNIVKHIYFGGIFACGGHTSSRRTPFFKLVVSSNALNTTKIISEATFLGKAR